MLVLRHESFCGRVPHSIPRQTLLGMIHCIYRTQDVSSYGMGTLQQVLQPLCSANSAQSPCASRCCRSFLHRCACSFRPSPSHNSCGVNSYVLKKLYIRVKMPAALLSPFPLSRHTRPFTSCPIRMPVRCHARHAEQSQWAKRKSNENPSSPACQVKPQFCSHRKDMPVHTLEVHG